MSEIAFAVQAPVVSDAAAFRELARRVEGSGFSTLYVADHLGVTQDPFAALAAAAAVTTTLRLGTYVLNASVRDPLTVAAGAATVDVMSEGRMILGLGAGHTPVEWSMLGREYPSAAARVGHFALVLDAIDRLLRGEVVSCDAPTLSLRDAYLLSPLPVRGEIPLLIGGNGARVLRLAGARASIAALSGLGRTLGDGHAHTAEWTGESIDERVGVVRAAAAGRSVTLDALVQVVVVTDDRDGVATRVACEIPGVNGADVLGAPYALIGSVAQLADEILEHRERWGFTSYVVRADAIDAATRVLDELRGR